MVVSHHANLESSIGRWPRGGVLLRCLADEPQISLILRPGLGGTPRRPKNKKSKEEFVIEPYGNLPGEIFLKSVVPECLSFGSAVG